MYYPTGQVGLAPVNPNFCTPNNVPAGCTPLANTAIPLNSTWLGKYRAMQKQINRALAVAKMPLIVVDGRPGPRTLEAIGKLGRHLSQTAPRFSNEAYWMMRAKSSIDGVAADPDFVYAVCKRYADGKPILEEKAAPEPITIPDAEIKKEAKAEPLPPPPTEVEPPPAEKPDMPAASLSFTDPLVIGSLAVVGLFWYQSTLDKGKGKRARRARYKPARRRVRARRR